jgi:hypothetical protein
MVAVGGRKESDSPPRPASTGLVTGGSSVVGELRRVDDVFSCIGSSPSRGMEVNATGLEILSTRFSTASQNLLNGSDSSF